MSEQKMPKENRYQFWRIVAIYLIILLCLFIGVGLLVTKLVYTGVPEEDITTEVERYAVSYQVVAVTTDVKDEDNVGYTVGFADKNKVDKVEECKDKYAPDIESTMQVLPTGMGIGTCYDAEWVRVVAKYSGSTVSKDIVSMQYTNQPITDVSIKDAKDVVTKALSENLHNYVRDDAFKMLAVLCAVAIVLGIVGTFIIDKFMAKYYKCTYWEEIMREYRDIERTVIDNEKGTVNYAKEEEQLFHNKQAGSKSKRVGGFNMDKMVSVSKNETLKKQPMSNISALAKSMGYGVPERKPVGYSEKDDITGSYTGRIKSKENVNVDISEKSPLLFDTAEIAIREKERTVTEPTEGTAPVFNNAVVYKAEQRVQPMVMSSEEFKPKHKNPFANAQVAAPMKPAGTEEQMVNVASNVFTAQNPFAVKENSTEVVVDKDNISGAINGAEMRNRKKG